MWPEHTSLSCWPAFLFPKNWTAARVEGSPNPHTLHFPSGLSKTASVMGQDMSSVSLHSLSSCMQLPCGAAVVECPSIWRRLWQQRGTLSQPKSCFPDLVFPRMFLAQQCPQALRTCSYKSTNAHTRVTFIRLAPVYHITRTNGC